jgi:cephalosporin-C deacetylase-like acetyl esterase
MAYEGWIMRIVCVGVVAGLMAGSLAMGQSAPVNSPKQSLDPPQRTSSPGTPVDGAPAGAARPAGGGANAAAAMGRPVAGSPGQAGREALYKYLDDIAAKDEAVRRGVIAGIATRAQAELRQQEVRARILELMGGGFTRTPLNAKVVGSTRMEGFRIEKMVYESQPNFFVTALLYVPEGQGAGIRGQGTAGAKLPAVVMAPGHASSGKAGDYAMAATFARNGFVVLSYDPIGQGERLQYPDPKNAAAMSAGDPYPGASLAQRATGEHGEAGLQPTLIGDAVARYFAWDGMRAVDYLVSRPEVDAEKIGAFGCSGGGAMTALLGAADKRVKAVATACYLTTMEELLPSVGAQDAEQSTPGFIASGFDFADWVELAAPRAYAMVGTVSDMFPWKGFLQTAQEARRFYSLFDATAAGVEPSRTSDASPLLPTPTGPTLNPDTVNKVSAEAPFQVIAGIGGHGNLRPITAQIVGFLLVHLAGKSADTFVAGHAPAAGASPFALPDVPKGALQVTATGQVATSYPGSETVFSLNLKRAKEKLPQIPVQTLLQVQTDVREVTEAEAAPGPFCADCGGAFDHFTQLPFPDVAAHPGTRERKPAILLVMSDRVGTPGNPTKEDFNKLAGQVPGNLVVGFVPRPSPAGGEETKAAILGSFYLTELRAELVGKTLLGMRVDDVIRAVDYLASRPDVDAKNITVVASGHMGLVALNAAVLDSRIKHVTVDHVLESYRSLLEAPMPVDAPQDILPGVLEKYDVPDLVRVLGDRVTATDWLPGTTDLSAK